MNDITRAALIALAERVEGLDGPDRVVDKATFAILHPDQVPSPIFTSGYGWREDIGGWWLATGEDSRTPPKSIYPPRYTASIDAARTLVPDGWMITHFSELGQAGGCVCSLGNPGTSQDATSDHGARTLPATLTAAAIRAHAGGME